MGRYFGTDGFRGEANSVLTADHAYKVGRFLGWYYNEERRKKGIPGQAKIVIGKDTRRSSYMFEYSLVGGIVASGSDAYLLHVTTTPSVAYIARIDDFDCGIMISASHNPYYDNGIKLINAQGEKMDEETIEKVEAAIERHRYIPSMAALLLGRNDSRIVGVVINDHEKYHDRVLEDGFVSASLNALCRKLEEKGLFMMVKTTRDISEIPKYASMWNMDALVLIGFCDSDYSSIRRESRIPFVVYDGVCSVEGDGIAMLTVDDRKGGLLAGAYLKNLGHSNVLCLTDNRERMDEARRCAVMEKVGKGEEMLIPMDKDQRWALYSSRLDYIRSFSSVFAISDYYALDFISFLNTEGISVPKDISVIGFDGTMQASFFSLTTIEQDHMMRAEMAVKSLEEFAEGVNESRVKIVDVKLREGNTVKRLCD